MIILMHYYLNEENPLCVQVTYLQSGKYNLANFVSQELVTGN